MNLRVKLVCLALVMAVACAEKTMEPSDLRTLQQIQCGRTLNKMRMLLCSNFDTDRVELPPLFEVFPALKPRSTPVKLRKPSSDFTSACCLHPCSFDEMLKFC